MICAGWRRRNWRRWREDLAQDATLRVMANLANFRGESRFTTWTNKIAIRLTISDLRRARYRDFSLDELTADGDLLPASTRLAGPASPTPEKVAERDDVLERIELALQEALTERQYQALVAVALKGIPMDVLAERMGTNRNALYKLIHDARRKLKNHLESQGISTDYMMNLFPEPEALLLQRHHRREAHLVGRVGGSQQRTPAIDRQDIAGAEAHKRDCCVDRFRHILRFGDAPEGCLRFLLGDQRARHAAGIVAVDPAR